MVGGDQYWLGGQVQDFTNATVPYSGVTGQNMPSPYVSQAQFVPPTLASSLEQLRVLSDRLIVLHNELAKAVVAIGGPAEAPAALNPYGTGSVTNVSPAEPVSLIEGLRRQMDTATGRLNDIEKLISRLNAIVG